MINVQCQDLAKDGDPWCFSIYELIETRLKYTHNCNTATKSNRVKLAIWQLNKLLKCHKKARKKDQRGTVFLNIIIPPNLIAFKGNLTSFG